MSTSFLCDYLNQMYLGEAKDKKYRRHFSKKTIPATSITRNVAEFKPQFGCLASLVLFTGGKKHQ